jgi:Flp pilus assembly protein TadD
VALNANHADNAANLACSYAVSGRPADAIPLLRKAMRLSPVYATWYLNILAFSHYQRGEHGEAEEALKLALAREPAYADCRLLLAVSLHERGRGEDARREAAEVRRQNPAFRLSGFAAQLSIVKEKALVAHLVDVLRGLGLD